MKMGTDECLDCESAVWNASDENDPATGDVDLDYENARRGCENDGAPPLNQDALSE
jgi:hypothetical protein